MRTIPDTQPTSRIPLRPFLAGAVVVALAVAGLAFLSEAFATGGQTVYLANIEPGGKNLPTQPSIVVTGTGGASAPAAHALLQLLIVRSAPYSRDFASDAPAPASAGLTVPPFDPLAPPQVAVALQVTLAYAIRTDAVPTP